MYRQSIAHHLQRQRERNRNSVTINTKEREREKLCDFVLTDEQEKPEETTRGEEKTDCCLLLLGERVFLHYVQVEMDEKWSGRKTRWLSRETRKGNNSNNNDDDKRDYYCDANIVFHCDGFFDIRIIVDRIHWLQNWYDQRTVLDEE